MVNQRLKLSAIQCESLRFNSCDSMSHYRIFINLMYSERLTLPLSHRMVHESLRTSPKISEWFKNHQDSPRIAPKKIQSGSQITKNSPKKNSGWSADHQELLQKCSEWFANHWESPPKNWISSWITKNHIKTIRSYIFNGPRPNDTDSCFCLQFQSFSFSSLAPITLLAPIFSLSVPIFSLSTPMLQLWVVCT